MARISARKTFWRVGKRDADVLSAISQIHPDRMVAGLLLYCMGKNSR